MTNLEARRLAMLVGLVGQLSFCATARADPDNPLQIDPFYEYDRGRNVAVGDRPRPQYDAVGIRAGAFIVLPTIDLGAGYSDNVLLALRNKRWDGNFVADPAVLMRSDWSRHEIAVSAGADTRTYFATPSQNEYGWWFKSAGRIDVFDASVIHLGVEAKDGYEDLVNTNSPSDATRPVQYQNEKAYVHGAYELARARFTLTGDVSHSDYDDVPGLGGGTIDQHFRDQTEWNIGLRGEYALSPDIAGFLQTDVGGVNFTAEQPLGQPDRNSADNRVLAGANFDLGDLVRGELGVGYLWRQYASAAYGTLSGPAVSGKIEYFPSPLLTITATGRRSIEDSVLINASGYFLNLATARADYELKRNIILYSEVSYEYDDFQSYDRRDTIDDASLGARYLLNRGITLKFEVGYTNRSSSGALPGPQYDAFRGMTTLTLQR
jgi:hypothetical protein